MAKGDNTATVASGDLIEDVDRLEREPGGAILVAAERFASRVTDP